LQGGYSEVLLQIRAVFFPSEQFQKKRCLLPYNTYIISTSHSSSTHWCRSHSFCSSLLYLPFLPSFLPSRLSMSTTRLCLSKPLLFGLSIDKNSSSRVCSLYLVPPYCLLFQIAVGHCRLGIWVGTGERETDRQTD
jgi:hypothetical protein